MTTLVPSLLLSVGCLCLASCTQFTARPLDAAASAHQLSARRLTGQTWGLATLTEEALRQHPDLAVARAKYETALAAVRTAGERPNPTLAVSPEIVTPHTAWVAGTYGVNLDWAFETAGKRSKRLNIARSQAEATAANVIDVTWKVRSGVRKAFLELYAAEQRSHVLGDAIQLQDELLHALDERIKAGSESRSASTQARLLQAQLKLQAAESAKLAAVARASLAEAMAMSTAGLADAKFSFAAFEVTTAKPPKRLQVLTHRADVLAALAEYAVSEATLRLEITKQYPDLHLNPGYTLDAGQNKWALGIGLNLPILNRNQGAIGEAEAKRQEAAANFDAVQMKVLAAYDHAAALLAAAKTKLATTEALIEEQNQQVAAEERLVKAGSGDRAALLSVQVERATTAASRIEALAEVQAALGALEEATQTPLAK